MRKPDVIRIADVHEPPDEKSAKIALFKGRPARERVIGEDDVLNLRIALNTCRTKGDLHHEAQRRGRNLMERSKPE